MHHSLYCSFHHARLSYRWLRSYEDSIDDSIKERGPITTSDATEVDAYVQPFSQFFDSDTYRRPYNTNYRSIVMGQPNQKMIRLRLSRTLLPKLYCICTGTNYVNSPTVKPHPSLHSYQQVYFECGTNYGQFRAFRGTRVSVFRQRNENK